ncbi:TKL family protein kinase [Histomonas meleagridis]|uniref:TKL family protein kinase n=1 Tax=Histomonas meleagridis TaxID=135588 RepID=UPI0035596C84|nr:TKL family protein kinase [Histomonas meleagridis]KAH0807178.1 TKL family protein kinase [Histomonas meleagridis]
MFQITHSDFKYNEDDIIGSGAFANVYVGIFIPLNLKVAIKKLHSTEATEQSLELYNREVEILAIVNHQFCLPFIGFTTTPPFCIVTKFIENGSLHDAIHNDKKKLNLTPDQLTAISWAISQGLQYLHSKNLIHRDLKPQNILLNDKKMPIICDFGSSRNQISSGMTGTCGTSYYMAPEFYQGEYNEKVDVYSYGLVLYEMYTKKIPFDGLEPAQVIYRVLVQQERPSLPDDTPQGLSELIQNCWATDPNVRPSFNEITKMFQSGTILFKDANFSKVYEIMKPYEQINNNNNLLQKRCSSNYSISHLRSQSSFQQQRVKGRRRAVAST